jgi:hypothetical protein
MKRRLAILVALAVSVAVACSGDSDASPSPPPTSGQPEPAITTPEAAGARVIAADPRFRGIEQRDRDLIGQGSWWDVEAAAGGFRVTVEIGWGDCPAGCINRHDWVFDVAPDGSLRLVSETGPPVPPGGG